MVGGDGIEQQAQHARIDDIGQRRRLPPHADEVGRVLHVGRPFIPAVSQASFHTYGAPVGVSFENLGVFLGEHLLAQGLSYDAVDLAARGPDIFQEDLLALLVEAERLLHEVGIHGARQRISDDERGRG